jgi:hypothetical protein
MTDNDFNVIPAVESLQNVPNLTPTQQRERRKRRPARPAPSHPADQEQPPNGAPDKEEQLSGRDDGHSIDYRA